VTTITGWLEILAATHGDAPALIEPGGETVSFAVLADRAAHLAAGLYAIGVRPGDRIAVLLPNGVRPVEMLFAAGRLGAITVGVSTRLRADDLRHVLAVGRPTLLISARDFLGIDFPAVVDGATEGLDDPPHVLWPQELDELRQTPRPFVGDLASPVVPLVAFSTSGTTGRPKLAAHDHRSVVRHAGAVSRSMQVGPEAVGLLAVPLCGTFGFVSLLSMMAGGAGTVIPERFEAGETAALVERHRVSHLNGSDDMVLAVLAARRDLRTWGHGVVAEFTNQGRRAVLEAEQAGISLTGVYGSSETFALLARWPEDWPADRRAPNGGQLLDEAMAVRAVEVSTGQVLDPGHPGELQFRGPSILVSYLGDDEALGRALTVDGWLRSGDLGVTEAGGRSFVYLARLGDSLRLSGFLTDPAEIEQRLALHPGVAAAQVVGTPGPGGGDVAVAFVVAKGPAPRESELVAHCRAALANYKVPTRVLVVAAFPTVDGPNGVKIRKSDLRRLAGELVRPT
jgi:fatty-acyl-CoA synthase